MARGGSRPGAGRKPGSGKGGKAQSGRREVVPATPQPAYDGEILAPRPQFGSASEFGLWALNAADGEVSMDQKLRAMQVLAMMEVKKPADQPSKKDAQAQAVEESMTGLYAPRKVKGFGVVDGGK